MKKLIPKIIWQLRSVSPLYINKKTSFIDWHILKRFFCLL